MGTSSAQDLQGALLHFAVEELVRLVLEHLCLKDEPAANRQRKRAQPRGARHAQQRAERERRRRQRAARALRLA